MISKFRIRTADIMIRMSSEPAQTTPKLPDRAIMEVKRPYHDVKGLICSERPYTLALVGSNCRKGYVKRPYR